MSISAWSQADLQQQYLNAKEFFNDQRYSLAMEAFKPLMEEGENNPFSAYASFYYAIAAYNEGYPPLAKNMLLQIKEKYNDWSKIDEVNLWLGNIYLENAEYNQGLNILSEIKDKKLQEEIYNLKHHYISQLQDRQLLMDLYQYRPEERVVGEILAYRIARDPLEDQDQELLEELIKKFDLNEAGLEQIRPTETVFKDSYKVAVLFPFLTDDLEANERKKVNQLVLDIYQGIRLAEKSLKDKGVNIQVYAYDTKRDSTTTANILSKDEMKGMDLLIGPLFPHTIDLAEDFSFRNRINMINPVSNSSELINLNPYSFLLDPADETIGVRTANHVDSLLNDKPGIIFYGETRGDSALAYSYKQEIEKKGHQIVMTRKIESDSTRKVLDILLLEGKKIIEAAKEEAKEEYAIALDSIGHIFVASDNVRIGSNVINALEARGDSIIMIGPADWLNLPHDYEVYHRRGAILYAPTYIAKETEAYEEFRQKYVKKHRVRPTVFAELGYETLMFTGKSLEKYGKYFQLGWAEEELIKGNLTYGFYYPGTQDNQLVPVMVFNKEDMKIIHQFTKGPKEKDELSSEQEDKFSKEKDEEPDEDRK